MPVSIPEEAITPATAIKAANFTAKLDDATDNDTPSPVFNIVHKHGYPKSEIELKGLKIVSDHARQDKRLSVVKSVLFAMISTVPAILLYLMGTS
jgi:hypothetical protein